MNKVELIGRLTSDPDIRHTQDGKSVARYTLAVDRRFKREDQTADFIGCVAFGNQADFAEKYMSKGHKFAVCGRIQTGSYTNKEGRRIYTFDVVVEETYIVETKAENEQNKRPEAGNDVGDGFMNIPDDIDADLPFA